MRGVRDLSDDRYVPIGPSSVRVFYYEISV
jgi:hypothetical protein